MAHWASVIKTHQFLWLVAHKDWMKPASYLTIFDTNLNNQVLAYNWVKWELTLTQVQSRACFRQRDALSILLPNLFYCKNIDN